MNTRRDLLIALGAVTFTPRALFAQIKKQPVLIGWLNTDSRESSGQYLSAFKEGLAAQGLKEGSQFVIEERWANGRIEPLQPLAEELAASKPAIIVATRSAAVFAAAKAAPGTPIVMASSIDPIAQGLAKSLARPGGMITGVTNLSITLAEKNVESLLAAVPKLRRIGFLGDVNNPGRILRTEVARRSAAQYKVEARFAEVASPEEIEPAISRLAKEGAQGLVIMGGLMLRNERQRIVTLALAQRWPVIAAASEFAEIGALLTYSADVLANYRRAAYYVDRILKGAKPGDLPIEQPTRFEFVVNLKTAKLLGLTMPPEIMVRATRVIE
jgi:putative ABC transport system substrate-binding protein